MTQKVFEKLKTSKSVVGNIVPLVPPLSRQQTNTIVVWGDRGTKGGTRGGTIFPTTSARGRKVLPQTKEKQKFMDVKQKRVAMKIGIRGRNRNWKQ